MPRDLSEKPAFVVFVTPSSTHSVCFDYLRSMIETDRLMAQSGVGVGYLPLGGDYYLWKARSKLTTMFLREFPQATDLFFLDDDIGWEPHKVLEFIRRPEDILLGIYPLKNDAGGWPCSLMGDGDGNPILRDGLAQVDQGCAGFMRIKRHVLEKMAEDTKAFPLFEERLFAGVSEHYQMFFFEGVINGIAWGEDTWFIQVCKEKGFEVWCDPDIQFTHRGGKTWRGRLSDRLSQFMPKKETVS